MPLKSRDLIDASDPRVAQIGHPAPPWLVNYADLMTEMVCFFVILYAVSAALNKGVQEAKKQVEETMKEEKIQGEVKVNKEGMQITIEEKGENVFFESGSAELSPRMKEIMAKLAPTLLNLVKDRHDIIVEGHTDDVPINNPKYPSNWELSTARATSVVQYMIHGFGFPPPNMAAIGYGQYHPLVPNDSPEHRATNRRVVFFVKNPPPNFKNAEKASKAAIETAEAATGINAPGETASPTGPPDARLATGGPTPVDTPTVAEPLSNSDIPSAEPQGRVENP
jgi:flagellar motor protein MotB